ncbi:MAG: hypothetical protein P1U70_18725 [Saprospiraceae bacterium]|nr:hypothetical protein [Saprospiraceae bacterium]
MVTVINFKQRQSADGKTFNTLELQGGIEFIQSKETGSYYATTKTTSITSTFDEITCKALIGQQLDGNIQKIDCPPYDYTIKETGEVIQLKHRYEFIPEGANQTKEEIVEKELVN